MKNKVKITPNIFLQMWIEKYGEKSGREYSQFLKRYSESGYSIQFYQDYMKSWKDVFLKKGIYQMDTFDFIFESFFPILKSDVMMETMSMTPMDTKIKINKNQKVKIQDTIENMVNIEPERKKNIKYLLNIKRREEKVYIEIQEKGIEYCWGPSKDFDILLKKLKIKNDDEVYQYLQSEESYRLNHVNEDLSELLNKIINKGKDLTYITKNFRIDDIEERDLYEKLKEMLNKKNYGFEMKTYELLIQYIYQYIYQFINFNLNDYDKLKKIRCMYQSYLFNQKNQLFETKRFYVYGKNNLNLHISKEDVILYSIEVLSFYEKLSILYMYQRFTKRDLILSIFLHRYDIQTFLDITKEYTISDIYGYWIEKDNFENYVEDKKEKNQIYQRRNLCMKNGLFLEDKNVMNFPTNQILGGLWEEDKNIKKRMYDELMKNMSLDGKYKNHKNQNLYSKNINQVQVNMKIPDYYYDVYEEIYLNPERRGNTKYAYCSLYYGNNQYFLDTITFGYSLYMSGTRYDRILLVTRDVPEVQKIQLSRFYNRIITIKELDVDPKLFIDKSRWYGVFNKLYAFYLDEYEKVMITDTDMLVFGKGFDKIFERVETPAGMCYRKELINTENERIPEKWIDEERKEGRGIISAGMLLIKPSKEVFFDMIMKIHPESKTNYVKVPCLFPEEGFLSDYFRKEWRTISIKYSFTPLWLTKRGDLFGVKEILEKIPKNEIEVIHYVGYKPWTYLENPSFIFFDQFLYTPSAIKYLFYWLNQYDELEELMTRPTKNMEAYPIMFLREFCNWDKISFKN